MLILSDVFFSSGLGPQNQLKLDNFDDKKSKHVMTGEYDDELVGDNRVFSYLSSCWMNSTTQNSPHKWGLSPGSPTYSPTALSTTPQS